MGMVFGGATTDKDVVTQNATINNLAAATYLCWVYPTTLTNNNGLMCKRVAAAQRITLALTGTTGNILFGVGRATTNASIVATNTPLATLAKWYCVVGTYDIAATPVCHLYVGDLVTPLTEVAGTPTDGSGLQGDDSTGDLWIGNDTGLTRAWQGTISHAAVFYRVLTIQ